MSLAPILDLNAIVSKLLVLQDRELSESDTEAKLVLPLLNYLGWTEEGDAKIIRQLATSTTGPRRVPDLRLVLHGTCVAIVETKRSSYPLLSRSGATDHDPLAALTVAGRRALDQAFRYALDEGVPFAWLTNGFQHFVARVFLQNTPLGRRLVFASYELTELVAKYSDFVNLSPERIGSLLSVQVSLTQGTSASESVVKRLEQVLFEASRLQLTSITDTTFGSTTPTRKFSRRLHVVREQYTDLFSRFISSLSPVLIFAGEAGTGKTSILCEVADEYSLRGTCIPLFVNAGVLSSGLFDHLESVLDRFSSNGHGLQRLVDAIDSIEAYAFSPRSLLASFCQNDSNSTDRRQPLQKLSDFELASNVEFCGDYILILRWMATQLDENNDSDRRILEDVAVFLENRSFLNRLIRRLTRPAITLKAAGQPRILDPLLGIVEQTDQALKDRAVNKSSLTEPMRRIVKLIEAKPPWLFQFAQRNYQILRNNRMTIVPLSFFAASLSCSEAGDEPRMEDWEEGTILSRIIEKMVDAIKGRREEHFLPGSLAVKSALRRLLLTTEAPRLLLMIDGVNEHITPARLQREIEELVTVLDGRLAKLVITCRTPDLHFFLTDDSALLRHSYKEAGHSIFEVRTFSEDELSAAWSRYQDVYSIQGFLGPALAEICASPLMLRFMCEAYAGEAVPEDGIRNWQIFEKYWDRKVVSGSQSRDRESLVLGLAQLTVEMYPQDSALPLATIREKLGPYSLDEPGVLRSLLSDGVIIYLSPDQHMAAGVRFTYEAFLEYVLARRFLGTHALSRGEALKGLLRQSRKSRLIRGALEYVALGSESDGNGTAVAIVKYLLSDWGSENMAVAVLAKVKSQECAAALFREIWPLLRFSHGEMLVRILFRHLQSGPIESCMEEIIQMILILPGKTGRTSDLMAEVARQAPPWLESIPAGEFSSALGFLSIWSLSHQARGDIRFVSLERTEPWVDCLEIDIYARDGCRSEDLAWFRRALEIQSNGVSKAGEVGDAILFVAGTILGYEMDLDGKCFAADGSFAFESANKESVRDIAWGAGYFSGPEFFEYLILVGKVCALSLEYGKSLGLNCYADRLEKALLSYMFSTWYLFIVERGTREISIELLDLIEDVRDFLLVGKMNEIANCGDLAVCDALIARQRRLGKVIKTLRRVIAGD